MYKSLNWYSEGINPEYFYTRKRKKEKKLKGSMEKTKSSMAGL